MAGLGALVLAGQAVDPRAASFETIKLNLAIAVAFTAMAALVLRGNPGHRVGRLMAAAGLISWVAVLASSWSSVQALAWLSQWSWWPSIGCIFFALLLFPDGRLPSRGWRPFAVCLVGAVVIATVALLIAALDHPYDLLTVTDRELSGRALFLARIARGAALASLLCAVGVVAALAVRWRRADGETRRQLACLLPAGIAFLVALALDGLNLVSAWAFAAAAVPAAMTVAILRYRLYGLDHVINRAVVWVIMSLAIGAAYLAAVWLIQVGLDTSAQSVLIAVAGLTAVGIAPVHRWVQRGVDRFIFGDSGDPHKVVAKLGNVFGKTADPHAVLPMLAETIGRSLQVPYVAVEVIAEGHPRIEAEHGVNRTDVKAFAMEAHGANLGRVLVGTRRAGTQFSRRENRLLREAAVQVGVAVERTRLVRELQESRQRLVVAREEGQRQLRHDLHDRVVPALVGMSMQVGAVRMGAARDETDQTLRGLENDLRNCIDDVHRIVDRLGPRELGSGLEPALRTQCRRFNRAPLAVELHTAGSLANLPAAVEMAVYVIVAEALANVVRHANARNCQVTITREQQLREERITVEIVDDGVGGLDDRLSRRHGRGHGLGSMRERTAELGGDFQITPADPQGTAIKVSIPLHRGTGDAV
jgi:signal transduction histidine kinase